MVILFNKVGNKTFSVDLVQEMGEPTRENQRLVKIPGEVPRDSARSRNLVVVQRGVQSR